MSLTKSDLRSIKEIVETRLTNKITLVDEHLGRVEWIVTAEVKPADEQSGAISRIRKQLRAV